jgi:hypothetical protein
MEQQKTTDHTDGAEPHAVPRAAWTAPTVRKFPAATHTQMLFSNPIDDTQS